MKTTQAAQSVVLGVLLAAAALPAQAHHEVGGYDQGHLLVLNGAVREFIWANPHVLLYVEVPNGTIRRDIWTLEGGSVQSLARTGWTRSSLQPGDHVEVLFAPNLHTKRFGLIVRVIAGDGRVLSSGPVPGAP